MHAITGELGLQSRQMTLDAIVTYGFLGTYLIAVFWLYPFFPANIAVILGAVIAVKGVFWSSDYPPFLCYNQGLIPWGSDTKSGTVFYLPTKSLKIAGKY